MSFSKSGICVKSKRIDRPIYNTQLKIMSLSQYLGWKLSLDFVHANKDCIRKHKFYQLGMRLPSSGITIDSEGTLHFIVDDSIKDKFDLDFLSFEKVKNAVVHSGGADQKEKTNGFLRLKASMETKQFEEKFVCIRFMKPNETEELDVSHIGFPINMPRVNESLVILTFKAPIPYFLDELELTNDKISIRPFRNQNYKYSGNCTHFNLYEFSDGNFDNITLRCWLFEKSSPIYFNDFLYKIADDRKISFKPIKETSLFTTKIRNVNSKYYFPEHGHLARFRYQSEVKNNNKSGLPINIKNLYDHNGSTVHFDLIKMGSEELHGSLTFYKRNNKNKFVINSNGSMKVIIDLTKDQLLSLESIGILTEKTKNLGEDAHNCRIRMRMNNVTEISHVIRHLDTKLTPDIQIKSVSFPHNLSNNSKIITLTFARGSPYYNHEFQLVNDDEIIQSIDPDTELPTKQTKNVTTIKSVSFELTMFKKIRQLKMHLICLIFNKSWSFNTYYINKMCDDSQWTTENSVEDNIHDHESLDSFIENFEKDESTNILLQDDSELDFLFKESDFFLNPDFFDMEENSNDNSPLCSIQSNVEDQQFQADDGEISFDYFEDYLRNNDEELALTGNAFYDIHHPNTDPRSIARKDSKVFMNGFIEDGTSSVKKDQIAGDLEKRKSEKRQRELFDNFSATGVRESEVHPESAMFADSMMTDASPLVTVNSTVFGDCGVLDSPTVKKKRKLV